MITASEADELLALIRARKYQDAESRGLELARRSPNSGFVWKTLGFALRMQGKDAVSALQRATELLPNDAEAHCSLGNALKNLRKFESAIASYRRALAIRPDFVDAHCNLGNTLADIARFDDAAASYRRALAIKPEFALAHNNLGNTLKSLGQLEDAETSCRRALAIDPDFAEGHCSLGHVLKQLGKIDDAEACYRRALAIKPRLADAHNGLGNTFKSQGLLNDAVASYRLALESKPDFAEAYSNLGSVLHSLGQLDEAVASFRAALQIKPSSTVTYSGLGNALHDRGQLEEALVSHRHALEIDPDFSVAHSNLLLCQNYQPDLSADAVSTEAKRFRIRFEAPLEQNWLRHDNSPIPDKRLKIGYVSGDFRRHAVAYFMEPVLTSHDKSQFEIFCYSNNPKNDDLTARLISHADHWQPCLGMSDDQLAQRIRADGIDILIDLAGHTAHNRLLAFARKPAPIQITYLGYPGTSGLSAMDYRLTDHFCEPEGGISGSEADRYYTETLLRLPDSMWCYHPAEDMQEITPLPALTNGYLTFGSFNNVNKIGSECISLWAALLRSLPTARLLMVTVPEGELRTRLSRQFMDLGVAGDRISYCGKLAPHEFQGMLQQMDITLDPFPVNGATTTCESLWLGVPVLTMVGKRFLSRAGLSVLSAARLPDFAVSTPEEFMKTAALLAENLPVLSKLRSDLREHLRNTPLLLHRQFTQNLESAYRKVWIEWCTSESHLH